MTRNSDEGDVPDLSGAAGSRAMLLRSYDRRATGQITLSAPRTAGGLVLLGWRILHRTPEQPTTQMMPLLAPGSPRAVGDARDLFPGPTRTLALKSDAVVDAVYGRPAAS